MQYSFYRQPAKLSQAVSHIRSIHPTLEESVEQSAPGDSEGLLRSLGLLKENDVQRFALMMNSRQVEQVLHALQKNPDTHMKRKLLIILKLRMKKRLYALNWIMLQHNYTNPYLLESMEMLCYYMQQNHLEQYEKTLCFRLESMQCDLVRHIVKILIDEGGSINEFFQKYAVLKESKLAQDICLSFFEICDKDGFINNRELFVKSMKCALRHHIGAGLQQYLLAFEASEYFTDFNEWLLEQLGRPGLDGKCWMEVSEEAANRFCQWLNIHELEKFYGSQSRKYQLWKEYYKDIFNVIRENNSQSLFIYFDAFVIVDTDPYGENAYLYKKNIFGLEYEKHVLQKERDVWKVDPLVVISAHNAIIEQKTAPIYSLRYEQTGKLYIREILDQIKKLER